ncbi:hypothetical protein D3C72_255850 [compost metagenome]
MEVSFQVIADSGESMDAHLDIEGDEFIFHSRGGIKGRASARNIDYGPALRLVLSRIRAAGARVEGAWLDTEEVRHLPLEARVILERDEFLARPDEQFRLMTGRMQVFQKPLGARRTGSRVKRVRIRVGREARGADLEGILGVRPTAGRERRLPAHDLNKVTATHIRNAVERLRRDPSSAPGFGPAREFEIVVDEETRLPPKAVFGLAASEALGFSVGPADFSGGAASICHRLLEAAGYPVVAVRKRPVPLMLEKELVVIDEAWDGWIDALEAESRSLGSGLLWMDAHSVMFSPRPSDKRADRTDIHLGGLRHDLSVTINAPLKGADANGLSAIARDVSGRRVLIRQGWLRGRPEVRGEQFRRLTGLTPVEVTGGTTPTVREWYMVADLDKAPGEIAASTADFVLRCMDARAAAKAGTDVPAPSSPPLAAGEETGGTFTRKAITQPEAEVHRIHGEVWLRLQDFLKPPGPGLSKLRHQAGYEVDGVIAGAEGRILLEIKTGRSAADVYEGVGQLMLYSSMLGLQDHRKVLLLAFEPSATLVEATRSCGVELYSYAWTKTDEGIEVDLPDGFLAICGGGR